MFPIFEQGRGQGIGHAVSSFSERFEEICKEHLADRRARAFAFIFYDFENKAIRKALKDLGVFAKLDRLSGNALSVFYLHSARRAEAEAFNAHFFRVLGIEDQAVPPCIVFFRMQEGKIEGIEVARLEHADQHLHVFGELHHVIESYLAAHLPGPGTPPSTPNAIRWFKDGSRFLAVETVRTMLKVIVEAGINRMR